MALIVISIGDWSNDGHGRCDDFFFILPNYKSVEDAREAFFKSAETYPGLDPRSFANEYQDGTIPGELRDAAADKGFELPDNDDDFHSGIMAEYVSWFIGLSGVALTALGIEQLPTLHFYGTDKKKRHLGHIGYGLFDE